jgi:hypothetical protein
MNIKDTAALLNKIAVLSESEGAPVCRVDALNSASDLMEQMEKVLERARLLCANLENGGVGHMTLVRSFQELDEKLP